MAPRIGIEPCPGEPASLKQCPWAVVQVTVSTDQGCLTLVVSFFSHPLASFLPSASQYGLAEHNAPECLPYDRSSVFDVDGLLNLFP